MFEEPLKCPSSGASNCSAKDSIWAAFEWDRTGLGAGLGAGSQNTLERKRLQAAPTEPLARLRGELLPHTAIQGSIAC